MGDYDELARRAEHGDLGVKPGTVRRGPEAAEAARVSSGAAATRWFTISRRTTTSQSAKKSSGAGSPTATPARSSAASTS